MINYILFSLSMMKLMMTDHFTIEDKIYTKTNINIALIYSYYDQKFRNKQLTLIEVEIQEM